MLAMNRCHGLRECHKLPIILTTCSTACYSNKKGSGYGKKNDEKKDTENKLPDEKLRKLNEMIKRMPNSSIGIVSNVQMSKPIGYKALKEIIDKKKPAKQIEKKPKDIIQAAQRVAAEIGHKKVQKHLLESVGLNVKKLKSAQQKYVFGICDEF